MFKEVTDGPGWSLILYFSWTNEALQSLKQSTLSPSNAAAKLLHEYLESATPVNSNYGNVDVPVPVATTSSVFNPFGSSSSKSTGKLNMLYI